MNAFHEMSGVEVITGGRGVLATASSLEEKVKSPEGAKSRVGCNGEVRRAWCRARQETCPEGQIAPKFEL